MVRLLHPFFYLIFPFGFSLDGKKTLKRKRNEKKKYFHKRRRHNNIILATFSAPMKFFSTLLFFTNNMADSLFTQSPFSLCACHTINGNCVYFPTDFPALPNKPLTVTTERTTIEQNNHFPCVSYEYAISEKSMCRAHKACSVECYVIQSECFY